MLGPLPADDPVVAAFAAGLVGLPAGARCRDPGHQVATTAARSRYLSAGMSRTLRKTANRLARRRPDGGAALHQDAGEILRLLPQLEQVYRQRDHVHGRISDLDDAVRQQRWRRRVRRPRRCRCRSSSRPWTSTASSLPTRWASSTDPSYRLLEGRFVTEWARYSPGRLSRGRWWSNASSTTGAATTFDWMTAVAPESLLGRNDADPMVLVRLG